MGDLANDLLAGASGHPVNRPALDAAVMQGQAMAGLRSAQTEDALLNAQRMREEQDAGTNLEGALISAKDANGKNLFTPSQAHFTATQMKFLHGGAQPALEAWQTGQKINATSTVADPNADPQARLAADQVLNPGANPYQSVGDQLIPRFAPGGQTPGSAPTVDQTPVSSANVQDKLASANLHNVQASVGGFNPNTGKTGMEKLPQDQQDALNQAMAEGRLSPKDLNSRNVDIYGHMALSRPGYNFNRAIADATLSRNPTFQQRAMIVEGLPGLMSNVTALGKKLAYPDTQFLGKVDQWFQGQNNDPALTEYMAARNDTIFKIANVMRGVGMSDKAVAAEDEIAHPTMSPAALDGWLKGQMSAVGPLMDQQRRAAHIGEPGVSDLPVGGGSPTSAPTAEAPQFTEGQTATNKATNQKMVFRSGKWQPL